MADGNANTRVPTVESFIGAMLGGGIGDALGWPVEGKGRTEILASGDLVSAYRPISRPARGVYRPAGSYSDDTQQSLVVAESIVASGKVDSDDVAARLLALWNSGRAIGYGQAFRVAMERLAQGTPWQDAADRELPWNGAAMRVGPVALLDWRRPSRLLDDVMASSVVTHRHPAAISAAAAIALAAVYALTHTEVKPAALVGEVEAGVRSLDPELASLLTTLPELVLADPEAARNRLVATSEAQWPGKISDGVSVAARPTVLASLYAFLRAPEDYSRAIEISLWIGGDVDSFAAIVGFLVGAHRGIDALPHHLIEGLQDHAQIRQLAEAIYPLSLR